MLFGVPGARHATTVLLVLLAACIAYDAFKFRRLHPAYVIGASVLLAAIPLKKTLAASQAWSDFAHWIMAAERIASRRRGLYSRRHAASPQTGRARPDRARVYSLDEAGVSTMLEIAGARPARAAVLDFLARERADRRRALARRGRRVLRRGELEPHRGLRPLRAARAAAARLRGDRVVQTAAALRRRAARCCSPSSPPARCSRSSARPTRPAPTSTSCSSTWALLGLPFAIAAHWGVASAAWVLVLNTRVAAVLRLAPARRPAVGRLRRHAFHDGPRSCCSPRALNLALLVRVREARPSRGAASGCGGCCCPARFGFVTWVGVHRCRGRRRPLRRPRNDSPASAVFGAFAAIAIVAGSRCTAAATSIHSRSPWEPSSSSACAGCTRGRRITTKACSCSGAVAHRFLDGRRQLLMSLMRRWRAQAATHDLDRARRRTAHARRHSADAAAPPGESDDRPWFIALLQGVAGWLAGIFLLVFLGLDLRRRIRSGHRSSASASAAAGGLGAVLRRSRRRVPRSARARVVDRRPVRARVGDRHRIRDAAALRRPCWSAAAAWCSRSCLTHGAHARRVVRLHRLGIHGALPAAARAGRGHLRSTTSPICARPLGAWTLPLGWLLTWVPMIALPSGSLRTSTAGWRARPRPRAPRADRPAARPRARRHRHRTVRRLRARHRALGHCDSTWWALFPLLSIALAMFAACGAFRLRSSGVVGPRRVGRARCICRGSTICTARRSLEVLDHACCRRGAAVRGACCANVRGAAHESSADPRRALIAATVLVLGAVNWSILAKERIKTNGERIFLALAPVDPRSLMQGDYMALRFAVAERIARQTRRGSVPLRSSIERGVATRESRDAPRDRRCACATACATTRCGSAPMRISSRKAPPSVTTGARFGEFRVDRDSGEAVLVGLRGAGLEPL